MVSRWLKILNQNSLKRKYSSWLFKRKFFMAAWDFPDVWKKNYKKVYIRKSTPANWLLFYLNINCFSLLLNRNCDFFSHVERTAAPAVFVPEIKPWHSNWGTAGVQMLRGLEDYCSASSTSKPAASEFNNSICTNWCVCGEIFKTV